MSIARDFSPVVFRGEPDNRLRERGDWQRPWFFTEAYSQAKLYAGNQKWPDPKDETVACVLAGRTVLDLTAPDRADARSWSTPVHRSSQSPTSSAKSLG